MFNTIIEIDYMENKYSYEQDQHKKKGDSFENPVVEILFSEDQDPEYSYRLGIQINFKMSIVSRFSIDDTIVYSAGRKT